MSCQLLRPAHDGDVAEPQPAGPEHPVDHGEAAEGVAQHHVLAGGRHVLDEGPVVPDVDTQFGTELEVEPAVGELDRQL